MLNNAVTEGDSRQGTGILPFAFASYTRLYWCVFCGILMTQLNWASRHAFHYDIMTRLALSLLVAAAIAPILHFAFSLILHPFFSARTRRIPELTASVFTPFLLCAGFILVYCSRIIPPKTLPVLFSVISAAGTVVWLVLLLSNRSRIPADAEAGPSGNRPGLLRSNLGFYARGTIGLVRDFFLPDRIMDPGKKRFFFQPILYPLSLVYAILIIRYGHASVPGIGDAFLLLLGTFVPLILFVNSLHVLAGPADTRQGRGLLAFLLVCAAALYFIFFLYHFTADSPFDLPLILINKDLVLAKDAFTVYASRIDLRVLAGAVLLGPVWMILLQRRYGIFTCQTMRSRSFLFPVLFLAVFTGLVLTRFPSLEETVLFGRSLIPNIQERTSNEEIKAALDRPYPYSRTNFPLSFKRLSAGQPSAGQPQAERPDVFLVILESFNRDWVGRKASNGKEVSPFFDSLIPQGVYSELFYGSSVQTSRGLFILFTGLYESYKGKTFRDSTKINLRPLPAILDEAGYRTVFFNAHDDLNFDNKGPYLRKMGFRKLVAMKGAIVADVPKDKFWNWGIQDDVFFRKSFEWLDAEDSPGSRKPLFAAFLTLSQHHPHSLIPARLRRIFPHARTRMEHFLNAQHLTDLFLREFFLQLEARPRYRDAIVVITSDHGFPWGKHGTFNEIGFYEESFRIPLLVIWKKGLKPRRITDIPYDQIDIAPTILDLLEIDTPNHFIGRSLFAPPVRRPLFMIQPYDGVYLIALDYPFKYVKHLSDGKEMLFNVENDPDERTDLSRDPEFGGRLERGRELLGVMRKNQIIIEKNRVWDPRLNRKAGQTVSGRR